MPHSRLILMLVGLGALSACGDADDRKASAPNDNSANVSLRIGGNSTGAVRIEGKFSLPKLKLGNSDVDIDGVQLYPGAHVSDVDVAGEDGRGEGSVIIRFQADAAPAAIRDYYLAAFKAKGVTATATGDTVIGHDHDGKAFSIALTQQAEGTRGIMKLGNKPS